MKVIRKQKKNKKNKKQLRKEQLKKRVHISWKPQSRKYSEYPYIVTVSFLKTNVFLSATDLRGRIKFWINAGRVGFKGADKYQYLNVITIANRFFKELGHYYIRDVFLKFSNAKRATHAITRAIRYVKLLKFKRNFSNKKIKRWYWKREKGKSRKIYRRKIARRVRFLGILTELHVSFNGCRKKKLRRKRHRRNPRRKRIK